MYESPIFQISSSDTKLCEIDHCITNYTYALGNELSSVVLKLYTFPFFLLFYFQHNSLVKKITLNSLMCSYPVVYVYL